MRPDTGEGRKRTNEIGDVIPLLETLPDIAGRTVTASALHTRRATAKYLLSRGADYRGIRLRLFIDRDHHSMGWRDDIEADDIGEILDEAVVPRQLEATSATSAIACSVQWAASWVAASARAGLFRPRAPA